MKFSYNWLSSLVEGTLPPPEELTKLLTTKLFEVDGFQKVGDDWIIDLDVLPSRSGDCLSHIGLARELAIITNQKFKNPLPEKQEYEDGGFPVEVEDSSDCLRYITLEVSGVNVAPSPSWLKEVLEGCGLQSINNVVDIANYVMLETGQPLHIFDRDKISQRIVVRRAEEGEEIVTLDNKRYLLKDQLLITDQEKVLAIAGIKGGKDAEVREETKNILIESALFNRKVVRRSSSSLKLRTDASLRFEYSFDPNLSQEAIERVALLINEITGGEVSSKITDIYPKKEVPREVSFSLERAEKLLGIELKRKEVEDIFNSLGFSVKDDNKIEIPTRRRDISIQEDLVEELGRIIGYDKVEPKLPEVAIRVPKMKKVLFWEGRAKEILSMMGFDEVYNHTLVSQSDGTLFEVENPVSSEQRYLRDSLLPQLIKNVKENSKFFDRVKVFELGKVFKGEESRSLAVAVKGESLLQLKGALEFLLKEMGVKEELAWIGTREEVSCFELDFDKLSELATEERFYSPISRYPETTRDITVSLPKETPYIKLAEIVEHNRDSLLKEIELIDIYEEEESKSYTLRLSFWGERTLTAEEVNLIRDQIIVKIEEVEGWKIKR